jgi:hypothetical protein
MGMARSKLSLQPDFEFGFHKAGSVALWPFLRACQSDGMVFVMKEVLGEQRIGGEGLCELRMDNIRIFVPVVDTDPHLKTGQPPAFKQPENGAYLSECTQARQNTASNPRRIFPFRRSKDLNPHIFHRQSLHLMQ